MQSPRRVIFILFLVELMLSGCAAMAPISSTAELFYNRHEIANFFNKLHHGDQVENKIVLAGLQKNNRINVTETDHDILVYGQVQNAAEKNAVNQILRQEGQNKNLYNELEIKKPISYAQYIRDSWTTTKLKSKFVLENTTNLTKIKVITDDDIVFLFGDLNTEEAEHAVELARTSPDAKKIVKVFHLHS